MIGSKYIECTEQDNPGGPKCSALFTADNEEELLEMAGRHAINVHGHSNIASYRQQLRSQIKEGSPPK